MKISLRAGLILVIAVAMAWTTSAGFTQARADSVLDARHVIEESAITVDRLREETKKGGELDNVLRDAKGVLIVPSFYKGAFIIGAAYGDGVMLTRLPEGGFGDPAFYRMTAGSLGLQIGGQSSEIVFVIRTEKGMAAVLKDEFKMGANAGLAIGSIGAGAEAATTTHVGQDIVAYSKAAGLFAGGSFEGAVIRPRKDWNAAVYGVGNDDPRAIIQRNGLRAAMNLKDTLNQSTGAAPATEGRPDTVTRSGPGIDSGTGSSSSGPAPVTSGPLSSPVQPESN